MRRVLKGLVKLGLGLVIALCLAITIIPAFLDRLYYAGPLSSHYDGERFFNPGIDTTLAPPGGGSRGGFLLRWLTRGEDRAVWPELVPVHPSRPSATVAGERMVVTWVGHATLLIQTQGLNILTDPVWSDRSGPFGIGPKRVTAPGIRFADLPRIDLVVLSHNHYDHMDLDALERVWRRDRPLVVASLGNDRLLADRGVAAKALDWGSKASLRPGIDVIVNRNHHWSSRWFVDRNRALWSSFVITLPGGNILFAGDTGFGDGQWPVEAAAHGPVRLALIPIGAFRFAPGMMDTGSHIGPIQAERVFALSQASYALPMHWGTFQLSNEARETPPAMLKEVMACAGYADPARFAAVAPGVPVDVPVWSAPEQRPAPAAACLARPAITGLK